MRKLLLQLDSSRLPSVFDRVVAYDGGADEVMSYGGVVEADVRDLIHGCIFTRGPKDLKNTAVFVGGADIAVGEQLLAAATTAMFKPFTVSAMLDSNGSNTTAVAAVAKMVKGAGDVRGKRVLIVAGTGPVGIRAAGLFAKAGADVSITSRKADAGERARDLVLKRFGGKVRAIAMPDASEAVRACERAELILNAGPAGVMLVPKRAWANRPGLEVVADVNAVPPLGIEGGDVMDDGVTKEGVVCFGALAIGNRKLQVPKARTAPAPPRNGRVRAGAARALPGPGARRAAGGAPAQRAARPRAARAPQRDAGRHGRRRPGVRGRARRRGPGAARGPPALGHVFRPARARGRFHRGRRRGGRPDRGWGGGLRGRARAPRRGRAGRRGRVSRGPRVEGHAVSGRRGDRRGLG